MSRSKGFTLIELLVVIAIIALLIGILLPALNAARRAARRSENGTNIRSIHQGFVIYGHDNNGYYPGRRSNGNPWTSAQGSYPGLEGWMTSAVLARIGPYPGFRYGALLLADIIDRDVLVSPMENRQVFRFRFGEEGDEDGNWLNHHASDDSGASQTDTSASRVAWSYALMAIHEVSGGGNFGDPPPRPRFDEWENTQNSEAPVVSDRLINAHSSNEYSVHTAEDSGIWEGAVAWNDNHVSFENDYYLTTRHGNGPRLRNDHLFDNTGGSQVINDRPEVGAVDKTNNAFMTFDTVPNDDYEP